MNNHCISKDEQLLEIISIFITSYNHKENKKISDSNWLYDMLQSQLPTMNSKAIERFCIEVVQRTEEIERLMLDLERKRENNLTAEMWLYNSVMNEYRCNKNILYELEKENDDLEKCRCWLRKKISKGDSTFGCADIMDDISMSKVNNLHELSKQRMDNYSININNLVISYSQNAVACGMGSIAVIGNVRFAKHDEYGIHNITNEEIVSALQDKGADTGIKIALAGALKVGAERNIIPVFGLATPAATLETVAYFAVENSRVVWQFSNNEISMLEALDRVGRVSVACIFCAKGMAVGAALGAAVPAVGPVVGAMLGKVIGNVVAQRGSVAFYNAAAYLTSCATDIVLSQWATLINKEKLLSKESLIRKFNAHRKEICSLIS